MDSPLAAGRAVQDSLVSQDTYMDSPLVPGRAVQDSLVSQDTYMDSPFAAGRAVQDSLVSQDTYIDSPFAAGRAVQDSLSADRRPCIFFSLPLFSLCIHTGRELTPIEMELARAATCGA
jgi:hypothetical protein